MSKKDSIIEIKIAEIDLYLIDKVRELRVKKKISQVKLSIALGLTEGVVSKIENPKQAAKYNIRHLNLLAKALGCSISELLPVKPLRNDIVLVKLKVVRNKGVNKGQPNYVILSKTPVKD